MKQKYRKDAFQDFESKMCKFRDNKKNFISIFHYFFFFFTEKSFLFFDFSRYLQEKKLLHEIFYTDKACISILIIYTNVHIHY